MQAVAGAGVTSGRDKIVADVSGHSCVVKNFSFTDVKLDKLGDDAAVISYVATQDASCDGKPLPARVYAASIYVRKDGKWRCTHYQETPFQVQACWRLRPAVPVRCGRSRQISPLSRSERK